MSDEVLWALGRGNGIIALGFLTMSIVLGVASRSGRPMFGLPRFGVAAVHRFTALAATSLVILHVGMLLLDPYAKLRIVDVVIPFLGDYRPFWQGLGTVAIDVILIVLVSSLLRNRLGIRVFRVVHWSTYLLWPVALAHALGNGTDAGRIWFQVFAGCCALAVAVVLAWRLRAGFTEYSVAC
ncbi:ferric reductase-like transmembrane domain-containing protein [Mycolicibacterium sp.]|uniref:ferric reductase-like transmembrane domain-containing protein n=1 Tax=Mycolicibacterium sp. TaxID=2320850 RepID=UPI001DD37370|nr:ferric reductase-like transmembrane domain-containing protein [Mycolicibacterium sp.]MCB1286506.1 ferric reductase-like transmembrane domain-containing protein [Mycobacterium sp.]MCB9408205.1 ferric reductase-like transmembrane domain-containing protein [Mycolicibacterium sp.]